MDKWICEDCGGKFYEEDLGEKSYKEKGEFWGASFTHTYYEDCCPECGGEVMRYYGKMDDEDEEDEEE